MAQVSSMCSHNVLNRAHYLGELSFKELSSFKAALGKAAVGLPFVIIRSRTRKIRLHHERGRHAGSSIQFGNPLFDWPRTAPNLKKTRHPWIRQDVNEALQSCDPTNRFAAAAAPHVAGIKRTGDHPAALGAAGRTCQSDFEQLHQTPSRLYAQQAG